MQTNGQRLDVLLIVPFQPMSAHAFDPTIRQALGAYLAMPLGRAMAEFEQFLGHPLSFRHWREHPLFQGDSTSLMFSSHRSLTAVLLATHLERAGLSWSVVDPGTKELRYWRRCFEESRTRSPRVVAISTTFVMSTPWLRALCAQGAGPSS